MEALTTVLLLFVVLAAAIFVPLIAIWSVNTLFLTAIPYTLNTWAAAFVLSSLVYGKTS